MKDEKVEWNVVTPTIQLMNRTAKAIVWMFCIGQETSSNQRERIKKSVTTPDTSPPTVSFLWKTHKVHDGVPPTRPVCDSSEGPMARASNLFCMLLEPMLKAREYQEEADSTEDMLYSINEANKVLKQDKGLADNTMIFSMDAEALYPSLDLQDILDGIWDLVDMSDLEWTDIDYREMGKYLAVMCTK